MGDPAVEREVLMAAHEGSERAEQAERRDIGDATLEQLHADVARLSVESMTGEPFPLSGRCVGCGPVSTGSSTGS